MNELRIPFKGGEHFIKYPGSWDELTKDQLFFVCRNLDKITGSLRAIDQLNTGRLPVAAMIADEHLQALRIKVLLKLCGASRWPWSKTRKALLSLEIDEMADVLASINFILEPPQLSKCPAPVITVAGRRHYYPGELLKNITGGEFHFTDQYFFEFKGGNYYAGLSLIATIYRPQGKGDAHNPKSRLYCGDLREPFNRYSLESQVAKFEGLAPEKVKAIALWYESCRSTIVANHPRVFKKASKSEAQGTGNGWLSVFRSLGGNYLSIDAVAKTRLSLLLWELNNLIAESETKARKK
jgi:hypothetical protein